MPSTMLLYRIMSMRKKAIERQAMKIPAENKIQVELFPSSSSKEDPVGGSISIVEGGSDASFGAKLGAMVGFNMGPNDGDDIGATEGTKEKVGD